MSKKNVHLHPQFYSAKMYNPLTELGKGIIKIMFNKQGAIVLLVFGASYIFDLLRKIIGGVQLTGNEWAGFGLIIIGIIVIWWLMNKFEEANSQKRKQELKEAWKEALKETGIQDALINLANEDADGKNTTKYSQNDNPKHN